MSFTPAEERAAARLREIAAAADAERGGRPPPRRTLDDLILRMRRQIAVREGLSMEELARRAAAAESPASQAAIIAAFTGVPSAYSIEAAAAPPRAGPGPDGHTERPAAGAAAAAAVHAARAADGAEYLMAVARARAAVAPPPAQSVLTRRLFEGAAMAGLNAGIAAAAAERAAAAGPDGPAVAAADEVAALYGRARSRALHVAAALPPDVRAAIAASLPLPSRPVPRDGLVRRAVDIAVDRFGAAAGACLPVRAGLTAAAAAAIRAACPVPDHLVRSARTAAAADFGRRVIDVGRLELAAGWTAAYPMAGPLAAAFLSDLEAAVRPAVDLLAAARPRNDKGYEYARGTFADAAAAEQVDVGSTARYVEAMNEGRFAGDMWPGLELPGALYGGRRTCGQGAVLGHIGGPDHDEHAGEMRGKPGTMSCDGRPCRTCWTRWLKGEARSMATKLCAGMVRARLADGGAPGGKRTPVIHLVISLDPAESAAWASGPEERAHLRKAALDELTKHRGRFWAAAVVDHSYRFTEGLDSAHLSVHLHVLAIGWLDYRKNADRFLKYKDQPYEVRPMRQLDGTVIQRRYGRCRNMFVKHLSTLDTFADVEQVCLYILSHSTSSGRRLGETAGGEHAVRWFGALANGRTKVADVSRYEIGDLIKNSGAPVPEQITSLTIWKASASDEGDDTLSRVEPRHVWTGSGPDACAAALAEAAADTQRDHPASAKNGGVVVRGVIDQPDGSGPPVTLYEPCVPTEEDGLPADDYLILKVAGHSRPAAGQSAREAEVAAARAAAAIGEDGALAAIEGAADVAAAAEHVQVAAGMVVEAAAHTRADATEYVADMLGQARARLRTAAAVRARARARAAIGNIIPGVDGRRLSLVSADVDRAAARVAAAADLCIERSRGVVIQVNSRLEHLCTCGHRLEMVVWDPGGGADTPVLPSAVMTGLGMGVDPGPDGDGDAEAAAAGGWIGVPAAGWVPARDWMQARRAPYLPAWDRRTGALLLEDGVLVPSPEIGAMAPAMQGAVLWDELYSRLRADLTATRNVDAEGGLHYRVPREAIRAAVAAMHTRPPPAAAAAAAAASAAAGSGLGVAAAAQ